MVHLQARGHGLHRFTVSIEHQPARIQPRLGSLIITLERREHLTDKRIQLLTDTGQFPCIHHYKLSRIETKLEPTRHNNLTKYY
ncbi:hypothetical protein ACNUDN_06012 [Mycobacterium sp. smrl_JER01]